MSLKEIRKDLQKIENIRMSIKELRKDLSEISSIMKMLNQNNRYNFPGSSFFKEGKAIIQRKGEKKIKLLIVNLAKKYQKEGIK